MIPAVDHAILAASNSLAASVVAKATIVLALVLVGGLVARQSRASIQHAIVAAGFAVLLALPAVSIVAPPIQVPLPGAPQQNNEIGPLAAPIDPDSVATEARNNAALSSALPIAPRITLSGLFLLTWAIGAVICLVPLAIGLAEVRRLRRTALPWRRGQALAAHLATEAANRRRVEVLLHESIAGPMTCGAIHPVIVFPVEAENWNDGDLYRAIAHEIEHVNRADWFTHCLARVACAIYWFHPLVWIAQRKLSLEAERACDDAVLARSEATAYAEQLVALARRISRAERSPLLLMAGRSDLAARVAAVLDARRSRGRTGSLALLIAFGLAAFIVMAISPIQLIGAARAGAQANAAALGSFEVASVKPHKPGDHEAFPEFLAGGRFTESGVPLKLVIAVAYSLPVQSPQLSGGPDWIGSNDEAYDIDAKAEDGVLKGLPAKETDEKMRLMLQALLADRFKLVVRRELKEQPVYILTVAKDGPKLQKSKLDREACADPTALCGAGGVGQGRGIHLKATTVGDMVFQVNNFTDRPLLDRTGLSGLYDIQTNGWVPMRGEPRPNNPQIAPNPEAEALADPSRPTLFMIFEQLGLKMEPSRAPVESFEIEHVERPSQN
jgi:bla regulator protein blaR1